MATFVVSNPSDTLTNGLPTPNTLRWAVEQADAATCASKIVFQLPTPAKITLTQGELSLATHSDPITITGLGADELTVSGGGAGRVFQIDPSVTASISGLTVSGGDASLVGGGLYNQGIATLTDVSVIGNSSGSHGGGLYNSGTATVTDCTISDNFAPLFGIAPHAIGGGGVDNDGTATLTDCTIVGNSGLFGSGLQNNPQGSLSLAYQLLPSPKIRTAEVWRHLE